MEQEMKKKAVQDYKEKRRRAEEILMNADSEEVEDLKLECMRELTANK